MSTFATSPRRGTAVLLPKSHSKDNDSTAGFTFESGIVLMLVAVVAIVAVIIPAILALWPKLL